MLSLSVVRGARYLRSPVLSSRKARSGLILGAGRIDETREIRHWEKRGCREKIDWRKIWSRRTRVFSRGERNLSSSLSGGVVLDHIRKRALRNWRRQDTQLRCRETHSTQRQRRLVLVYGSACHRG